MTVVTSPRVIRVGAVDDALIHALTEHRSLSGGWRVEPLRLESVDIQGGIPEPDALVVLDLDHGDAQRHAIDSIRTQGFTGRILIIGNQDAAASADNEPIARPVRLGALLTLIDTHWLQAREAVFARLGPYEFLPEEFALKHAREDGLVRLTELECKLLVYLTDARGDHVSREQLLAAVWGYSAGIDTHTVETHIWRLRQKIENEDPATRFLVTEAGGYRLLSDGTSEDS
ncbi:MAG: two-component system response regulator [Rhodospirillales bacterium]|nr:two-component system response regulator [Rhodospirillales bacterium]